MPAETLNCPMCGAPATSDASCCEHCGARLATVACPSCFGLIFSGAKFCSHCGAKVGGERTEVADDAACLCPRCRVNMDSAMVGATKVRECPRCEGLWVDSDSLQQIYTDREKQAAILGAPIHIVESANTDLNFRYVPCPICGTLMNRVNFANCSHVIVDVCRQHGTWFDKDELRRIVEFIRAGGFEAARAREMDELEQRRQNLRAAQYEALSLPPTASVGSYRSDFHLGASIASAIFDTLFK